MDDDDDMFPVSLVGMDEVHDRRFGRLVVISMINRHERPVVISCSRVAIVVVHGDSSLTLIDSYGRQKYGVAWSTTGCWQ